MSINKVVISGNLTRDPELRATQSGMNILTFGMAVNDRRRNPQTQEWEDYANFVDCVLFGNRAEYLSRTLHKGIKVVVEGKLRYSSWERDGQRRSKLEVVVDDVDFVSPRQQQGGYSQNQQQGTYTQQNNYNQQQSQGSQQQNGFSQRQNYDQSQVYMQQPQQQPQQAPTFSAPAPIMQSQGFAQPKPQPQGDSNSNRMPDERPQQPMAPESPAPASTGNAVSTSEPGVYDSDIPF